MILFKRWFTKNKIGYKKYWNGWFLFGFIPLVIKQTDDLYQ